MFWVETVDTLKGRKNVDFILTVSRDWYDLLVNYVYQSFLHV